MHKKVKQVVFSIHQREWIQAFLLDRPPNSVKGISEKEIWKRITEAVTDGKLPANFTEKQFLIWCISTKLLITQKAVEAMQKYGEVKFIHGKLDVYDIQRLSNKWNFPGADKVAYWAKRYLIIEPDDAARLFENQYQKGTFSTIDTAEEFLRFCLHPDNRFANLTEAGRQAAYDLKVLDEYTSPVSPIVPEKKRKGSGSNRMGGERKKLGRPSLSAETQRRDNDIYYRRKAGESYQDIADYFKITKRDAILAVDRMRKRLDRRDG